MGWVDNLEEKNQGKKYLSAKEGQVHEFVVTEITTPDRGDFNIFGKDYCIEIRTKDDKVLTLGTVTAEIALRKLASLFMKEGNQDPLINDRMIFSHPNKGRIRIESKGKWVQVTYDRANKKYPVKTSDDELTDGGANGGSDNFNPKEFTA